MINEKKDYTANERTNLELEKLENANEHGFLQLCKSAGYYSFVFDTLSQSRNIEQLEDALKIADKRLKRVPIGKFTDIFNRLEKAYLKKYSEAVEYSKTEDSQIHGSVFEGAYDSSYEAKQKVEELTKAISELPKKAEKYGLKRLENYVPA